MTNTKNLPKIIAIVGATSSNKTKLGIKLAKKFNGEIINADAFQVYQELNVGVNKPTEIEQKEIKFHLVNEVSIKDEWDIKVFQEKANKTISQILKRKKLPIIVGGSNLYVDCLIKNYDLEDSIKRTNEFEQFKNSELFEMVSNEDKNLAKKIGLNNRKRLIRALQVMKKSKNKEMTMEQKNDPIYDCLMIHATMPRVELYKKIDSKVEEMVKKGWVDEVLKLYNDDKTIQNLNAFKAIGYREILASIISSTDLEVSKIKQNTRNYAKRQLTWITNKFKDCIIWNQKNDKDVFEKITKWQTE